MAIKVIYLLAIQYIEVVEVEREITEKLSKVGLVKGYHYDFDRHPGKCLWTAYYDVARKIAKVMERRWDGYNIDFAGGYYYWNL